MYKNTSFLKGAETLAGDQFLGMNNLPKLSRSTQEVPYIIDQAFDERPDLLAAKLYGSSAYWYVFALKNPDIIKDPIRDFKAGTTIILPGEDSIRQI